MGLDTPAIIPSLPSAFIKPLNRPAWHAHRRRSGAGRTRPRLFVPRPPELDLHVGDIVAVPLGTARGARRGVGRQRGGAARTAQSPEGRRGEARLSAAERGTAPVRRLGGELHALRRAAWCCAWRLRMGELGPERERVGVRLAGPAAAAHDAGTPPRARRARGRLAAHQVRSREGCRRLGRRDRWPGRRRHARSRRAAARAGRAPARSRLPRARADRAAAHGGRHPARRRHTGRLHGRPARRRHRLGQDRSLFRGDRRDDPQGPPVAGPDARDRAHRAIPRPLRAALRRAPGRMAFRAWRAQARAHLERGRGRRGECRGRRALGAVSSLCGPRPDRGR